MANPIPSSLIGLSREELGAALAQAGVAEKAVKMRVAQLWNWIYARGASDFAEMSNLAKDFRRDMAERFTIARPEVTGRQISADGTRKWLIRFGPNGGGAADNLVGRSAPVEAETVFIPEADRGTLCISSQIGCTLNCSFCHTGTQKLVRNLTAEEILQQILIARDDLEDWPKPGEKRDERRITNIVMMGMGEPLYNFDNVQSRAARLLPMAKASRFSKRRITHLDIRCRAGNAAHRQLRLA